MRNGCIAAFCLMAMLVPISVLMQTGCTRSSTSEGKGDDLGSAASTELNSESASPPTSKTLPSSDGLGDLVVYTPSGEESKLSEYMGKHNLVLVFSRGFFGSICPFCSTQMHALAEAYPEFEKRNARVVVVFPISNSSDRERWKDLEASILARLPSGSQLPFPILIDRELAAVDRLGIREELSKPSTFIVDTSGAERYRYIGSDPSDRPEVATILEKLDGIL
jgi:peroxiredoxin